MAEGRKFAVYTNQGVSAALTGSSLRPKSTTLIFLLSLLSASSLALFHLYYSGESENIDGMKVKDVAWLCIKVVKVVGGLTIAGSLMAFMRATSLWRSGDETNLSKRQLTLLGIKPKVQEANLDSAKRPPKTKPRSSTLVPLHQPINSARSNGDNIASSQCASPGVDQFSSTPWSNKRAAFQRDITTEEAFEKFLADVDDKISESASKLSTPPPTTNGFGIATPNNISSSANTSGTATSTPLRPVRMSPTSQKFTTPPKKGEGDFPSTMSMEESIEAFENLGIYPQIVQWRDHLRQWFSSVLINPLLDKIDTSPLKVMQAASRLGISIAISQVGSDTTNSAATAVASPIQRTSEWQPAYAIDEEALLHQLRATLVQHLDSCTANVSSISLQQSPQQNRIPLLQEGIDAITEHQKLLSLMKGEWGKGLLPHSSVRADYTVKRIRELAEGTCLRNYEYLGNGEVYDKTNKKWTLELPTDSHLLLYLFCAFLEHPKWMLHVDPSSYAGVQSSKNPLFFGALPPKERFPEKYIAVLSGVPYVLHPGACILAVGKQSSPIFALYWDKKLQFSLQGRTALWDSILLLCHKMRVGYGGIVRGMHLGSSALGILQVLNTENDD
ncbi:hypothetical protein LIER_13649 [Lithospermum erythrorhizon]|uniref:Transmembrane protein 209 n=1 Tax=Lithospermum erythrorhizon TaxID=34254 RepID=A0AAV3PYF0_LITER